MATRGQGGFVLKTPVKNYLPGKKSDDRERASEEKARTGGIRSPMANEKKEEQRREPDKFRHRSKAKKGGPRN